jgi:hypothetical protein
MTIERLRQAKAALEREGSAEAAWLVGVIAEYEAKAPGGLTLDRAAGLVPQSGQAAWWTAEQRRARDELIRQVRDSAYPNLSADAAAAEIIKQARVQRTRDHRRGAASGAALLIAEAIDTGAPFPETRRHVARILRDDRA